MMASPSELTLDCKPHTYSLLLKSFADHPDHTQKLEDFLARLEEERLKIEVFKRELPLCMQLLTEAVEASRQQLQSFRANQGARPFLEEFIPLKHSTPEGPEKASNVSDKANWMTSAQLWSPAADDSKQQSSSKEPPADIGFTVSPKLGFDNKQRNGGAFLPFSKDRNSCPSPNLRALPDLALANSSSDHKDAEDKKCSDSDNGMAFSSRRENCGKVVNGGGGSTMEQVKSSTEAQTAAAAAAAPTANTQTHRKARRCWSPDLHRRFVNALQMLGGSQVATPKQIRELMKVDGLTNDEVKSHLQKYRLHTRRPSPSPQAAGAAAPQLVVLGGIWVPPEYATAAHAAGAPAALYGAHPTSHPSPHYCGPPVPQDFYAAAAAAAAAPSSQMHHHHGHGHGHSLHHQLHMYKASPQTQNSPDSEVRGAGDRSESIEDGKSESSSWKGESGDNGGGERKGLGGMRDDGEESNRAMEVRLLSSTSNF